MRHETTIAIDLLAICASQAIWKNIFPVAISHKISPKSLNRAVILEIIYISTRNTTEQMGRLNVVGLNKLENPEFADIQNNSNGLTSSPAD